MNKFIIVAFLVAIGYQCCLADESTKEAMMKFHQEMSASVCKPDTTDNAIMGKILECKKKFYNIADDKLAEQEAKYTEKLKDCFKDDELKAYTKVDLKSNLNRIILSTWCSQSFMKCMHEKYMKAKESKTEEQMEECHQKSTPEQRAEFQTCLKKAVGA